MAERVLDTAEDDRLHVYRDLRNQPAAKGGRFIVEGEHILERLIASGIELESVVVSS